MRTDYRKTVIVRLEPEDHRRLKILAASTDRSIQDIASGAIMEKVNHEEEK